jgi:hypothetical protein
MKSCLVLVTKEEGLIIINDAPKEKPKRKEEKQMEAPKAKPK